MPAVVGAEEGEDVAHQFLHRRAAMVPRDVRVQIEPYALDAVVVRAVRREEVQDDATAEFLDAATGELARVDELSSTMWTRRADGYSASRR